MKWRKESSNNVIIWRGMEITLEVKKATEKEIKDANGKE